MPKSVANDPDRLARFQREAEVLARLNRPNIAQIHGLEKGDGTTALVMETLPTSDIWAFGAVLYEMLTNRPARAVKDAASAGPTLEAD